MVAQALHQSVQSFPPVDSLGTMGFWGLTQRGPILPNFGTRERDRQLRLYKRHDHNGIWQGSVAGLIKKIVSTPFKISGPEAQTSRVKEMIDLVHFGWGWKHFISLVLDDYLNQDFGAVVEIIGPGDPDKPLLGAVTGLAHLDSLRCYSTGNPEYPIIYYSSWSGKMHRMHRTRVFRWVDNPDADERMFGSGMCALSRAVGFTQQQIYMNRYVEQSLDDKPQPGIAQAKGLTKELRDRFVAHYMMEQSADNIPVWGRTLWLYDLDSKLDISFKSFAQPPEKFQYETYMNIHVNAIALALGVDKQELWELSGQGIGTGAQSQVLAQKARGKAFGDILSSLERMLNNYVLPPDCEFKFEHRDEEQDQVQADIDRTYAEIAERMKVSGLFSDLEIRQMLANSSETFRKTLSNSEGQVTAYDDDRPVQSNDITVTDSTTADPLLPVDQPPAIELPVQKDFSRTRKDFESYFIGTVKNAKSQLGKPRNLAISLRARLRDFGEKAYLDGKRKGGDSAPLDDDERVEITRWLAQQNKYIEAFAAEAFDVKFSEPMIQARAAMWSNKSLQQIYNAGLVSSGKNKRFKWVLGKTEKHCSTCLRLNGQVHKYKEWYARGYTPKSQKLECGGWLCDCALVETDEPSAGRF